MVWRELWEGGQFGSLVATFTALVLPGSRSLSPSVSVLSAPSRSLCFASRHVTRPLLYVHMSVLSRESPRFATRRRRVLSHGDSVVRPVWGMVYALTLASSVVVEMDHGALRQQ